MDECNSAYEAYAVALRQRHRRWPNDPRADRRSVFPEELAWVADSISPDVWHEQWWAAKSSQTLALTLLAAAAFADPTLRWLPFGSLLGMKRAGLFEVELAEHVLNERPRQTQLDFLAIGNESVVAVEAKFTEKGFGPCSCERRGEGICSPRVYERPYWDVAKRELGLREVEGTCALSVVYQPVRNIAAAAAIAGPARAAAFALLYDRRNPYFSGTGRWPGWVAVLDGLAQHASVCFKAMSWQQLLAQGAVPESVGAWAKEKHGLLPESAA